MPTISEIRQQYPQYGDMTDDQLADALYSKFYSDMPRDQFNQKVGLAMQPAFVSGPTAIERATGESLPATRMVNNIPSSAVNFANNVVQPIIHPIETATNIKNLGEGILQKVGLLSGSDKEKFADAVGKFFLDRYGSAAAINKTIGTDPVGFLADLSTVLSAGGAAAARAPGVAGQIGEAARTAGAATNPINAAISAGKGIATGVRDVTDATSPVVSRAIGNPIDPRAAADAEIVRALGRDNVTLDQAQAGLATKPGVSTLADVGGENVQGLAERVSQTPGAGRTVAVPALTGRQQQQLSRIGDDLKELTGTKQSAFAATTEAMADQAKNARPLYESAYEAGDRPIWNKELERLSAVPEVQSAMKSAVAGWQRSQIANGYGAMNPGAMVDRGGQLSFLNGKVPAFPNLQFWDYTKAALDQIKNQAFKNGETRTARDLTVISQKLRGALDAEVPQYAPARQAWAGPQAFIDAIEDGKNISKMSPEEVAATLSGFDSEAQKQAFRIGAVSSVLQKAGNNPAKLADITQYVRSPQMRANIAAIMPTSDAAAEWAKRLNFEVGSSTLTGRALSGSPTARRLFEMADSNAVSAGDLIQSAFAGKPPKGLFAGVLSKVATTARDTLRSKTDQVIAETLFSPTGLKDLKDRVAARQIPAMTGAANRAKLKANLAPLAPFLRGQPVQGYGLGAFQLGRGTSQ